MTLDRSLTPGYTATGSTDNSPSTPSSTNPYQSMPPSYPPRTHLPVLHAMLTAGESTSIMAATKVAPRKMKQALQAAARNKLPNPNDPRTYTNEMWMCCFFAYCCSVLPLTPEKMDADEKIRLHIDFLQTQEVVNSRN